MIVDCRLLVIASLSGLALGSYAVTSGIRWSRGEAGKMRSACDACGRTLPFAETVPLLSYVRARGRCRGCGQKIDPIHLVGEAAGAVVVLASVWNASLLPATLMVVMGLSLIAAAATDLKVHRLPDRYTLIVALAAFGLAAAKGSDQLVVGVAAAVMTALGMLLLRHVSRKDGQPGLGLGDIKLASAIALWLGAATPLMIVAASVVGLVAAPMLRNAQGRIPFGPMLGACGWTLGLFIERGGAIWPV